jgi:hypothetical protein
VSSRTAQLAFAIAGWIIIHVTWAQLQEDPAGVVRRVCRELESRDLPAGC